VCAAFVFLSILIHYLHFNLIDVERSTSTKHFEGSLLGNAIPISITFEDLHVLAPLRLNFLLIIFHLALIYTKMHF
jgi:hypothetical protein